MARTLVTPIVPPGSYPQLPLGAGAATFAPTAADIVNLNAATFGNATQVLVLALNTDAALPHTIDITSSADGLKRIGDIENYSIAAAPGAGESRVAVFGPFKRAGWRQVDTNLYFSADDATVKFLIVPIG